jgi:hypothetical protein
VAHSANPHAEHALVVRCLRGDRDAQAELCARYLPLLKNTLAHHFAPNPKRFEIAENLAMDVFEQLTGSLYVPLRKFDARRGSLTKFLEQLAFHERWIQEHSRLARQQRQEVGLEGDEWEDHNLETLLACDTLDFRSLLTRHEEGLLDELLAEKPGTDTA